MTDAKILEHLDAIRRDVQLLSQKVERMEIGLANADRSHSVPAIATSKPDSPPGAGLGSGLLFNSDILSEASEWDEKGGFASSPKVASPTKSGRTSKAMPNSPDWQAKSNALYPSRITLTTYPGQVGVDPLPLNWGAMTPTERGPVIVSRSPTSLKKRNAIGAHGGSYSIYRALAVVIGDMPPNHRPDFRNTLPHIKIGPYSSWSEEKIVSMDPFGHVVAQAHSDHIKAGLDIRPSIAITKAHMQLPEMEQAVEAGRIKVDNNWVVNRKGDLRVTKGAIEPVWWLPGVAKRFNVDEALLRRALFEDTGGSYPELITRPDLKVFLPPIGGISIYIFGPPEYISDPTKHLSVRVHDECNGSDVFGSDICTCRPYLIHGIEECVRSAQDGGAGLIVYFRKEGRALGEVTKYLVYNARKRAEGGDTAEAYFARTESVAGVKDARFQALMPDVLHWLGITKIDRFISMSNMKYDAVVGSGIKILNRIPIPDEMIPDDGRVEIEAKIAAGYFSAEKVPEDLSKVKGRIWEDVSH
ncbi:Uracil-regulated protein 1 [Gonapodya sp. JEL0774]|nr:Uracil-regulated protein 1 [Gonapodya sp. JEL0774]